MALFNYLNIYLLILIFHPERLLFDIENDKENLQGILI